MARYFWPGLPVYAQEPSNNITEISVCTQEWVALTNYDMAGLYWDTIKAVFEPTGIKISETYMPYKISIVRVREKACDVAFSGYLNEYSDLLYSQWPHEVESVIAVHASDKQFHGQRSFINKKFAWVSDYGFELYLPANIEFTEVRSEVVGLVMLRRGSFDYFLDYEQVVKKAAVDASFDLSGYTFSPVIELSKMVYPMFRHDDRGAVLVSLYGRRMAELHKDGTLDLIYRKYKTGSYPAPLGTQQAFSGPQEAVVRIERQLASLTR